MICFAFIRPGHADIILLKVFNIIGACSNSHVGDVCRFDFGARAFKCSLWLLIEFTLVYTDFAAVFMILWVCAVSKAHASNNYIC